VLGLALVIAIRQNPASIAAETPADHALLAAALSNQNLAVYVAGHGNQEWNLPVAGFEYTNLGQPLAPGREPHHTTTTNR